MKAVFIIALLSLAGCSIRVTSYQLEQAAKFCQSKEGVAAMNMGAVRVAKFQVVCKNGERTYIQYE